MTTTKADIANTIHKNSKIPRVKATELIESLIEIFKSTLSGGEDILISGFGKFCVRQKKERRGRNPQTGEDLLLPPRKVITFQCSGALRNRMNEKE